MREPSALRGPDLAAGVPIASVQDGKQLPQSPRRNALPVERINRLLLMRHEHPAYALVEGVSASMTTTVVARGASLGCRSLSSQNWAFPIAERACHHQSNVGAHAFDPVSPASRPVHAHSAKFDDFARVSLVPPALTRTWQTLAPPRQERYIIEQVSARCIHRKLSSGS